MSDKPMNIAADALVECEKAVWKEGQTLEGLTRDIRQITAKAYKKLEQLGFSIVPTALSQDKSAKDGCAPYGYCPQCHARGVTRERRPNGNDQCQNGHTYPSKTAIPFPQHEPLTSEKS